MFRPRSIGLMLALLTLLVYLPATFDQFIDFDDPDYVADNQVVQNGLTWAGVKWAFTGAHAANWHPLTWLSHMADCDLFRLNPAGPHLVNILFHSVNAALLFTLLFRLTKKMWPSAFVAALFAWHPLHIESVAWVSERKDVLSTFFALLSLLSYTSYVQKDRRHSFWIALFFFALALLSKPMPVTLPLVMLLLDYWPLNRVKSHQLKIASSTGNQLSTILEKWPFFLLAAASCVVTFFAQQDQAVRSLAVVPLGFRLENMLTSYAGYLWKMVWPLDLAIFYPLRAPIAWHLISESAIILAGVSAIVWRERKHSPWLIVGWLWFLVTLLPVIGLVQVGGQTMADRYSYFPLIGIFLVIAFSAEALAEHFSLIKKWLTPASILILGGCILMTEKQLRYWRDSESLFTHALAVEDSETAHISLGVALQAQNRVSEAMTQYILALRLDPESELAYGNLAKLFNDEGKLDLAAVYYREAVKFKAPSPLVHDSYGIVLVKLGHLAEAINEFSAAARVDATDAQPHFLMGRVFLQQGRDTEAVNQLQTALRLDPNNLEILIFTVSVLAADENPKVRNGAEAFMLAEKAVKLTGGQQEPALLDTLAMACAETGQFDQAVQIQQQAIKLSQAAGQKDDMTVMQQRLQLYQKRQPWRESFTKN
jgi:tetratricopeptide (TPR) repeat protein